MALTEVVMDDAEMKQKKWKDAPGDFFCPKCGGQLTFLDLDRVAATFLVVALFFIPLEAVLRRTFPFFSIAGCIVYYYYVTTHKHKKKLRCKKCVSSFVIKDGVFFEVNPFD
jgi:uncharacterized protein YbaR (Trm112 family)